MHIQYNRVEGHYALKRTSLSTLKGFVQGPEGEHGKDVNQRNNMDSEAAAVMNRDIR